MLKGLGRGLAKVRLLHRASCAPIYGAGVGAELGRPLSSLYPLLCTMEAAQFLERETRVVGGRARKYYRITPRGRRALDQVRRAAIEAVDAIDGGVTNPHHDRVSVRTGASREHRP